MKNIVDIAKSNPFSSPFADRESLLKTSSERVIGAAAAAGNGIILFLLLKNKKIFIN